MNNIEYFTINDGIEIAQPIRKPCSINIKNKTINENQRLNLAYEISYEKNAENKAFKDYVFSLKSEGSKYVDSFGIKFSLHTVLNAERDAIFSKEEIFLAHLLFDKMSMNSPLEDFYSYTELPKGELRALVLNLKRNPRLYFEMIDVYDILRDQA